MDFFILLVKGFFIGIAFSIPGLSGGTMAIYLNVYQPLLHAIGSFSKDVKANVKLILPLMLGVIIAIISVAKLLGWLLDINSFLTLFFFIGLMIGGLPTLFRQVDFKVVKRSGYIAMVIAFLIVIGLFMVKLLFGSDMSTGFEVTVGNAFYLFLIGAISAIPIILPGISGSAVLVTLGVYTAIFTNVLGNILDFSVFWYNAYVLGFFAIGCLLVTILVSKTLDYLLTKHKNESMLMIIGFLISSVIVIFLEIRNPGTGISFDAQTPIYQNYLGYLSENWGESLLGIVTFVGGFFLAKWFTSFGKRTGQVGH